MVCSATHLYREHLAGRVLVGARLVKAVTRTWSSVLKGRPLQLLMQAALTVPDRADRPRVELSREAMAAALGFTDGLSPTAARAVRRAVAKLIDVGAWVTAQSNAPGRRCHYWLETERPSMEQRTILTPVEIIPVDGTEDSFVPCSESYTSFSTQEEELTDTPTSCLSLVVGEGTSKMTKKRAEVPGQRSLLIHAVPDVGPVAEAPARRGHPVVAAWVDYCTSQKVKLPRQIIGQYARGIATALADGFDADMVKRVLAGMLADGVANRPSLLANRLVAAQTGPEVRHVTVVKSKLVEVNGRMLSGRDLDNLRRMERMAALDAADEQRLAVEA
jgi:hypothetical protein